MLGQSKQKSKNLIVFRKLTFLGVKSWFANPNFFQKCKYPLPSWRRVDHTQSLVDSVICVSFITLHNLFQDNLRPAVWESNRLLGVKMSNVFGLTHTSKRLELLSLSPSRMSFVLIPLLWLSGFCQADSEQSCSSADSLVRNSLGEGLPLLCSSPVPLPSSSSAFGFYWVAPTQSKWRITFLGSARSRDSSRWCAALRRLRPVQLCDILPVMAWLGPRVLSAELIRWSRVLLFRSADV